MDNIFNTAVIFEGGGVGRSWGGAGAGWKAYKCTHTAINVVMYKELH